jgi:hypothetical protein
MTVHPGLFCAALAAALCTAALAAPRTFVASVGNDANTCSIAQPCRSFSAALSHTDAGGEIVVLDSAGYGPVTITKSVTIEAPAGVLAGISVPFNQTGVVVDAPGSSVVLRGLRIAGAQASDVGIDYQAGIELRVERCVVEGLGDIGVSATAFAGRVAIADTVIRNNGAGVLINGIDHFVSERTTVDRNALDGYFLTREHSGRVYVLIVDGSVTNNGGNGVIAFQTGVSNQLSVTISRTAFLYNSQSLANGSQIHFFATGSGAVTGSVDHTTIAGLRGIRAETSGSGIVSLAASSNTISDHFATGILATGAGVDVVATANVIHNGAVGMAGLGSASVRTTGDNVLFNNTNNFGTGVSAIGKF